MLSSSIKSQLFREVDNSPLVFFRIVFGFLCFAEAGGALLTGWVEETFVEPNFSFTFIGFEWLHFINGPQAYFWFGGMAILGLCIMLGLFYRASTIGYMLMWACVYFAQKSHYNNHYYLLLLLLAFMALVPAANAFSLDTKFGRIPKKLTCPRWTLLIFIFQLFIVYTYAAFSKIYPDWLAAEPIRIWFRYKQNYPLIGDLLQERWVHYLVAYGGIAFDMFIIPALWWRRTRPYAFAITFFFHLFNSFVFQIGIFPYLMLGMNAFFFPPEQVRKFIFRRRPPVAEIPAPDHLDTRQRIGIWVLSIYFVIQILLPVRYHLFDSNVHWSEEGHRLAWKMMLRAKSGKANYIAQHPETGKRELINIYEIITRNQRGKSAIRPDMIWQLSQHLDSVYAKKWGVDPLIFVEAKSTLNGHPYQVLIDPTVDLSAVPWEHFKTADWILPWNPDSVPPPSNALPN